MWSYGAFSTFAQYPRCASGVIRCGSGWVKTCECDPINRWSSVEPERGGETTKRRRSCTARFVYPCAGRVKLRAMHLVPLKSEPPAATPGHKPPVDPATLKH